MSAVRTGLLGLLLGCLCQTSLACPQANCVRIGSWNIEWLGSSSRTQPQDDAAVAALARLMAEEWSIDLIALQEINTELEGRIRGETFSRRPWENLRKTLESKGYTTVAGNSGYAQHVVLAWRPPVSVSRAPDELALPESYNLGEFCKTGYMRKPLAGQFRAGQFDFWLVGLHLKSAAGQTNCSSAIRQQQSTALLQEIGKLKRSDPDIILAGDFNASQQHATLEPLLKEGFHALHQRKLRHPQSNRHSYHSENARQNDSGSLIDHILVQSRYTKEWLPYSAMIFQPRDPQSFAKTYSDHVPVWADFSMLGDDD